MDNQRLCPHDAAEWKLAEQGMQQGLGKKVSKGGLEFNGYEVSCRIRNQGVVSGAQGHLCELGKGNGVYSGILGALIQQCETFGV